MSGRLSVCWTLLAVAVSVGSCLSARRTKPQDGFGETDHKAQDSAWDAGFDLFEIRSDSSLDVPDTKPPEDNRDGNMPTDGHDGDLEAVTDLEGPDVQNDTCSPNCEGRQCGDDGCGGSCGACGDDGKDCTTAVCLDGLCVQEPASSDGQPCDDGNPCTENDVCEGGSCFGQMLLLDQLVGLKCVCKDEEDCVELDDSNICNGKLTCSTSGISGEYGLCVTDPDTIPVCDDSVACTIDSCDEQAGCEHVVDSTMCDDNKPCTINTCLLSGCDFSEAVGDGIPCQTDPHWRCLSGQCQCLADDCTTLGKVCGVWEDGCGGTTGPCGTCDTFANSFCDNGLCGCLPDTCATLGKGCGDEPALAD